MTAGNFFAPSFQKAATHREPKSNLRAAIDRPRFERIFADAPFCASRSKTKHMLFNTGPRGEKLPVGRIQKRI